MEGFTTVFGMGTGVTLPLLPPETYILFHRRDAPSDNRISDEQTRIAWRKVKPRPISTGQLSTLLRLHTRPINLVFYKGGSYQVNPVGDLILGGSASRLDAFSAYPIHT